MSTSPPPSPTLQEQLKEKREQMGFKPPKEVERRTSQKQAAIRELKESGKYARLGRGGRKSRKMRKSRRRLTKKR